MFYDFISDVLSGVIPIEWYYYRTTFGDTLVSIVNDPRQFIYNYFLRGSKNLAFFFDPGTARRFIEQNLRGGHLTYFEFSDIQNLSDKRALHTISTFFLGLMLENCIDGYNALSIRIGENDFPFSYLWFLLCLYHDFGYTIEDDKVLFEVPVGRAPQPLSHIISQGEFKALRDIKKRLGITISPYSLPNRKIPISTENGLINELTRYKNYRSRRTAIHTSTGEIIESSRYSSKLITRYFNYCINERKRFDHGILGGFLFYDRMIKNYIMSYEQAVFLNRNWLSLDEFWFNDRHFSVDQIPAFRYLSDCIIAHNIWKGSPRSHDKYEHYRLDELFEINFERISFAQNPMLFLLVVADTIDPCKVYETLNVEQSWQGIDFDYRPESKAITVKQVDANCPINVIYEKAKELESWTTVLCSDLNTQTNSFIVNLA